MTLNTVAVNAIVRAVDLNQIVNALTGASAQAIFIDAVNSTTDYALTARNRGTGSKSFRVQDAAGNDLMLVNGTNISLGGNISFLDHDVVLGTTTGTKFGTSASQKCAFHNATPVIQRASANQAAAPAGGTGATAGAYDTAANRDALITLVNEIRTVLVEKGLMKGSA